MSRTLLFILLIFLMNPFVLAVDIECKGNVQLESISAPFKIILSNINLNSTNNQSITMTDEDNIILLTDDNVRVEKENHHFKLIVLETTEFIIDLNKKNLASAKFYLAPIARGQTYQTRIIEGCKLTSTSH